MNICLESVCSLCHALGCQGHSFPKHQELAQRRAVNAGRKRKALQISCGSCYQNVLDSKNFWTQCLSYSGPFSARSEGCKWGLTPRLRPGCSGKIVSFRWSFWNLVLAVVGELEERSAFCSLPRSTAQEDPSLLASGPLCWQPFQQNVLLIHAALELAITAPGRLDCVSPGGPRVAAEWSTPFPACRVCNQLMRTRRMSIHTAVPWLTESRWEYWCHPLL